MDHAINQLRDYMRATIDMNRDCTKGEMRSEMKAYVESINRMEMYYYGEKQTSLDQVLSNFREDE